MSLLTQPPSETSNEDRFRALCAELEDYEHLPELIPGSASTRLLTAQSHEDAIHESILAWMTQP
jgi:hypothetical protein